MKISTPGERTLHPVRAGGVAARGPLSAVPLVGVVNAADTGWIVPLPEASEIVVGRASDCDITISDGTVSRRHLRVFVGDELTIEDLGSANGSTYDGALLQPYVRTTAQLGRPIGLGSATLFVHAARGIVAPGQSTPSPAPPPTGVAAAVVRDAELRRIYGLLPVIAPSPLSVLVLGETGVGKEVFADAIHRASPRRSSRFLKLNCAALPESILEGELFGYERGAFSGAVTARAGLFESASGGTVFLDEVGDLPLATQAKLLRVLESGEVLRLGSRTPTVVDVRFIAATNKDLQAAVSSGAFRPDLYYRLEGVRVEIPPLRDRPDDIVPLAELFLARLAGRMALSLPVLSPGAQEMLCAYAWPGNVRELRNVVERALVMNPAISVLEEAHLLPPAPLSSGAKGTVPPDRPTSTGLPAVAAPISSEGASLQTSLDALEKQAIENALASTGGNQTAAARLLGIGRHALINRMTAYGLDGPRKKR